MCIAMQFMQPAHNKNGHLFSTDISKAVTISDSVQVILKNACYDCHGNKPVNKKLRNGTSTSY